MSPTVRRATEADLAFWRTLDHHISESEFRRKVRDGMAFVICADGAPIGVLRYSLFWDEHPFCNLLYIAEERQRQGCGRALMQAWEAEMRDMGYKTVLVSTQADEEAQHFYRKLGYLDCGCLLLGDAAELFLRKDL